MSVNLPFKGSTMTVLESDQFVRLNIEVDMIAEDCLYQETKWWDYRPLHSLQATMYFARTFYACASPIMTREVSKAAGQNMDYMSKTYDLTKQSRQIIRAWWRARMAADAMCVPYETYCRAAIKNFRDNHGLMASVAMARIKGKHQELPYPSQLVSPFILKEAITQWAYDSEKDLIVPESDIICHNPNLWFRPEMEDYIKKAIVRRAAGDRTRARNIAKVLVERGLLLPK